MVQRIGQSSRCFRGAPTPEVSRADGDRWTTAAIRHVRAWFVLVAVLALHVVDEALTGFLDFYNPLVLSIRSRLSWFPMPTFSFRLWMTGLVILVVLLAMLGPVVRRGATGTRLASWILSVIMFLNGVGHLSGAFYFGRWLPGTTTAPLLLYASVALACRTWERSSRRAARRQTL